MTSALVLALVACSGRATESDPHTEADTSTAPRTWTLGRTHDGDWVDALDSELGFAVLRADSLVLSVIGFEHEEYPEALGWYTRPNSGSPATSLCSGPLGFTPDPPCVLAGGQVRYPDVDWLEPDVEIPENATSVAEVLWEDGSGALLTWATLACATGTDAPPCLGEAGVADITGLSDAVSSAVILVSDGERIMVANGDGVRRWNDGAPPRFYPILATQLASGTGTLALDEAGGVWSLERAAEERVADGAVAIGGQLWRLADGTVVGPEPWPGEAVLQGPSLPAPATKLAGDILYGCALLDHDLWCWSAYDEGLPFADYVTSEEEQ